MTHDHTSSAPAAACDHCAPDHAPHTPGAKSKPDYLFYGSVLAVAGLYALHALAVDVALGLPWLIALSGAVFALMNTIWWGITLGIIMVAVLGKIPREYVMAILGTKSGLGGIVRATLGGVLLDLCSHGILMVAARLYERGASAGQVVAFLVASPWNSFSLTLVLIALIGLNWTLVFIGLSVVIAIIAGLFFDMFVARGVLPANPNRIDMPQDFKFWAAARNGLTTTRYDGAFWQSLVVDGYRGSKMVLRWILFGVVLAGLVSAFVDTATLQTWFGPSLVGLGLTVAVATIMEVCSEGSTPIAADLLTRAQAPGNSFAFLMTGVATDYTEIMVLKDTTKSWKFALFLPLITLPQVLVISWLMNLFALK